MPRCRRSEDGLGGRSEQEGRDAGRADGPFVGITYLTLASKRANAAWTWTWDCSTGTCRQIPVCNSALDLPPLRPPEITPPPPLFMKPIPGPVLPPIGTRSYDERYLCKGSSCRWEMVCE